MKRYILAGLAVVMLLLIAGAAIALAAGNAVVAFSGPTTVEIGKTYTYTYTMTVNGAAAANANIVVGGAFEKVSGGAGLFYDTIPQNSWGSVSGSVTVRVKSNAAAGSTGTISVNTQTSKCAFIGLPPNYDVVITDVTGSIAANVVLSTPAATAAATNYNTINLSWNAIPDATGYEIFRSVGVNGGLTLYATTSSPSYSDTGLATGTTHYYRIRAYKTVGETKLYGGLTGTLSATPVLGTVTNARAAVSDYNIIDLTWNSVAGADGYEVFRSVGVNGGLTLYRTISATSLSDTGLATGTAHYYRVRAYRMVGGTKVYGGLTGTVSATTPTLGAVTNAQAVSGGYVSINLTWNAVADATGYEIFRSVGVNGGLTLHTTTTSASYTDAGLASGTTHYYRVRAYRTIGGTKVYGGLTNTVSATTRALGTVTNPLAVSGGFNRINLTWNAVTDATGYEIFRSVGVNGGLTLHTTTTSASYTDTELTTGTPCYYRIRAYRMVGETKIYGGLTGTIWATPVLGAVTYAQIATSEYNVIDLTWNAVTDATGYEIFRSVGVNGGLTLYATTASASYTDAGLVSGTTHYYRVRAYRMIGETKIYGGLTNTLWATTRTLGAVTNAQAEAGGYDSIGLTWSTVTDATGYEIFRSVGVNGGLTLHDTTTSASYTDTGLDTGKTCYYRIRAYRTVGETKVYGGLTGTIWATPVLGTVTNAQAASGGPDRIALTWNAVAGADGYEIFRSVGVNGGLTLHTTTASASYTDTGLTTGTACYYRIRAYRMVGGTKVYGGLTGTVSATPVMVSVTNARAVPGGYDSIDLTWNAVTGADGYEIFRSVGVNGGLTLYTTTTAASYTDTGLDTGTTCYYRIRPYWMSGETKVYGGLTGTISATPVLGTVANALAASGGVDSINLTWNAVAGADGYEIFRSVGVNGGLTLHTTTTTASYADTGLTTGTACYYRIRAYRMVGGTKVYGGLTGTVSATPTA